MEAAGLCSGSGGEVVPRERLVGGARLALEQVSPQSTHWGPHVTWGLTLASPGSGESCPSGSSGSCWTTRQAGC